MELSLILFILGFILVVFLIFKFIKKIVFAVITLILLVVAIIGSVFGLVYLDYNHLTSQQDFDLKLIYTENEELIFGASIPITNQSLEFEKVSGILPSEAKEIDVDSIDEEDNIFVITIEDNLYEQILTEETYQIEGLDTSDYAKYDLSLTREEVLSILESEDSLTLFLDIMFEKNNISELERKFIEPIVKSHIENEMNQREMTMRQIVFLSALSQSTSNQENLIRLVEGFKEEEVQIYPERFTFKLVRMLPVDTIKGFLPSEIQIEE